MSLCEPVTDMGRRGDFLEYVNLLHEVRAWPRCSQQMVGLVVVVMQILVCLPVQAAELPANSLARLLKVAAFAVSIYGCVYRPFAPFRSPTGETCEVVALDKGIRAFGEKVNTAKQGRPHCAHAFVS